MQRDEVPYDDQDGFPEGLPVAVLIAAARCMGVSYAEIGAKHGHTARGVAGMTALFAGWLLEDLRAQGYPTIPEEAVREIIAEHAILSGAPRH
jgi:hypothetical protein